LIVVEQRQLSLAGYVIDNRWELAVALLSRQTPTPVRFDFLSAVLESEDLLMSDAWRLQRFCFALTVTCALAACGGGGDSSTTTQTNRAPVIGGTPPTTATVGSSYVFTPTAGDPDGDTLTFSISGKPSWATFDTATGQLTGTPGAAGTFNNIVITVSDGQAAMALNAFTITVQAAGGGGNSPPTISGNPPTSATEGQTYSFTPTASDPDGDPLNFSITGRPSWAVFNPADGQLTGTPGSSDVRTFSNIVISVSDGQTTRSLAAFSITVAASGGNTNTPPTISGNPPTSVLQDSAYSFTPTANDADGDTLTFAVAGLPSWAAFNTNNGRISGTPTGTDVGTSGNIAISVTDGQATAFLTPFTITVVAVATGSATLNWQPPTQNTDGTTLTDLAGFKVYWGTSQGTYPNTVTLNNPGLTSYVVDQLTPATWYFVTTAFNKAGLESDRSNVASKTIP
jgi:Putative Ig domain